MKSISISILIGAFFMCNSVLAQWKVGPTASIGKITLSASAIEVFPMDNFQAYDLAYVGSSSVTSVGFMAFNNLGPVFVETGFLATTYGLDFSMSGYRSMEAGAHLFHEQFYNLEIPFAAGVNVGKFRIGVGPVVEVPIDIDSELSTIDNYRNTSKSVDYGFQGMAAYNYGIFHLQVRYINKFSSITDGFSFGYDEFKYKQSANRLTIGIGITL